MTTSTNKPNEQLRLSDQIRLILFSLGPRGTRFSASDVSRAIAKPQRASAVTALQRLIRQNEIEIVSTGGPRGHGYVYATAEVRAVAPAKPSAERVKKKRTRVDSAPARTEKIYPPPIWAMAWPKVYEGVKQRQGMREHEKLNR